MIHKIKELVRLIKIKELNAIELKKMATLDGFVRILTAGKTYYHTNKFLPSYLNTGEIVAISVGGSFNCKYHNGDYYSCNNYIFEVADFVSAKYLYHFFNSKKLLFDTFYQGWGCKKLKLPLLLNVEIMLPSLEKQREIVRILDKFTELIKLNQSRKANLSFPLSSLTFCVFLLEIMLCFFKNTLYFLISDIGIILNLELDVLFF
jgi:restriction endonuclease S subunit